MDSRAQNIRRAWGRENSAGLVHKLMTVPRVPDYDMDGVSQLLSPAHRLLCVCRMGVATLCKGGEGGLVPKRITHAGVPFLIDDLLVSRPGSARHGILRCKVMDPRLVHWLLKSVASGGGEEEGSRLGLKVCSGAQVLARVLARMLSQQE